MRQIPLSCFMVFISLVLLHGCGGGSSSDTGSSSSNASYIVSGTAATGLAINGTVYIKDSSGAENMAVTNPDGSFQLDVAGLTGPFMLKVMSNGVSLYSYALSNNQLANVSPLSDLALYLASGKSDLGAIYDTWEGTQITASSILNAQAVINANLASEMSAAGLDPLTYNFLTQPFNADGTGFDGLLDTLTVSEDPGAGTYSVAVTGNGSFIFNESIDTSSVNIDPGSNAYSVIPANLVGTYMMYYEEEQYNQDISAYTGSNDRTGFFTVAADSESLSVSDGSNTPMVLTQPVFYHNEAIWFDSDHGLHYELLLTPGDPDFGYGVGIIVANDKLPDEPGYAVYGRFSLRDPSHDLTTIDSITAHQGVYTVRATYATDPAQTPGTLTIDDQGNIDVSLDNGISTHASAADYDAIYSSTFNTQEDIDIFLAPFPALYPRIHMSFCTDINSNILFCGSSYTDGPNRYAGVVAY